ncbi:hypothetical protein Nepgr_006882 [Nepenthes gracilis]|uniref:WEB family protein n=1 Tax=Nepenthes gracilis TaxID=150966 RepID=A0AAD3S6M8_NEPGR|nr:hypothetical protein Nepgr_006882 [Nepenthes gracilis]
MAAETAESATQTYDDVSEVGSEAPYSNPRAEIDTSPPFGSVEEAVIRFGGRGYWIPRPSLGVTADELDIYKLEEKTGEMLKDLNLKEEETLDILKELESTKRLLGDLKLKVHKEASECLALSQISSPADKNYLNNDPGDSVPHNNHVRLLEYSNLFPPSAGLIMMELKQAKLNLYRSTNDLAAIRASIESLNKKMEMEKCSHEKARERQAFNNSKDTTMANLKLDEMRAKLQVAHDASGISRELRELNYEAEQFMKTAEAARAEVLKAMSDIEQKKRGLKLIEMKWAAAKKLEEAARAAEAVALAEIRALSSENTATGFQHKPSRIDLSLEEYSSLTNKARKADNLCRMKDFEKLEETTEEKISEMTLQEALGRVEVANRRKVAAEEALRRFGSDPRERKPLVHTRRDTRLLNAKEFGFVGNDCKPVLRPSTSIGDFLSRKLVTRDDSDVERGTDGRAVDGQRVSLNQMLHKHRRETSPLNKRNESNAGDPRQFSSKRKTLGFVHISLPLSKQSKNKIQAWNLW